MAIQKEIWINSIVEGLFPTNTFAARSIDHSEFVNNKTIHVPGAGASPTVTKSRASALANLTALAGRTDIDLSYNVETYYAPPVLVENPESLELSYNKRESVLSGIKSALQEAISTDAIIKWIPTAPTKRATTGAAVNATAPGATGSRNSFGKSDVRALATQFNKDNVPQEGRCLLLDADLYGQLLEDLTSAEGNAFLQSANAQTGIVGKIYGFDVYVRSTVVTCTAAGTVKTGAAAATDSAGAIAWSDKCVSRAIGTIEVNENIGDAIAMGDVLSAAVNAGASYTRNDKKGIILIYQGTPA